MNFVTNRSERLPEKAILNVQKKSTALNKVLAFSVKVYKSIEFSVVFFKQKGNPFFCKLALFSNLREE